MDNKFVDNYKIQRFSSPNSNIIVNHHQKDELFNKFKFTNLSLLLIPLGLNLAEVASVRSNNFNKANLLRFASLTSLLTVSTYIYYTNRYLVKEFYKIDRVYPLMTQAESEALKDNEIMSMHIKNQ